MVVIFFITIIFAFATNLTDTNPLGFAIGMAGFFSKKKGPCCPKVKNYLCHDCQRVGIAECCSKGSCNMFCCDCSAGCRHANACQTNCGDLTLRGRRKRDTALPEEFHYENGKELVKYIDLNEDGSVSLDEVFEWFQSKNVTRAQITQGFQKIDVNNDNKLTAEEIDPSLLTPKVTQTALIPVLRQRRSPGKVRFPASDCPAVVTTALDVLDSIHFTATAVYEAEKEKLQFDVKHHAVVIFNSYGTKEYTCGFKMIAYGSNNVREEVHVPEKTYHKCMVTKKLSLKVKFSKAGGTIGEEVFFYKEDFRLKKIVIESHGYTPLIFTRLCLIMDRVINNFRNFLPTVCLNWELLHYCGCKDAHRSRNRSNPRGMLGPEPQLKLVRGSKRPARIEIDVLKFTQLMSNTYFVRKYLNHLFNMTEQQAKGNLSLLCSAMKINVWDRSQYDTNPSSCAKGCPCKKLGIVLPNSCKEVPSSGIPNPITYFFTSNKYDYEFHEC